MHIKQETPFYIAADVDSVQGTVCVSHEGAECYESMDAALYATTKDLQENGGEVLIYHCVAVKRVTVAGVKVEDIKEIG